jgi:hypothetical protein
MKKLTEEEKAALTIRPMKKQGYIRTLLMNMKVKEIILIEPKDWTWKTKPPSFLCRRVEADTTYRFDCQKVMGGTGGWVITRLK